jgi:hypothetical protein
MGYQWIWGINRYRGINRFWNQWIELFTAGVKILPRKALFFPHANFMILQKA